MKMLKYYFSLSYNQKCTSKIFWVKSSAHDKSASVVFKEQGGYSHVHCHPLHIITNFNVVFWCVIIAIIIKIIITINLIMIPTLSFSETVNLH